MKIFVDNIDWVDEGNVFCLSYIGEDELEALKSLVEVVDSLSDSMVLQLYWGTNENFEFDSEDILRMINSVKDITPEEEATLTKFGVYGYDILDAIIENLPDEITNMWLNDEDINKLKDPFIKMYSEEDWENLGLFAGV